MAKSGYAEYCMLAEHPKRRNPGPKYNITVFFVHNQKPHVLTFSTDLLIQTKGHFHHEELSVNWRLGLLQTPRT